MRPSRRVVNRGATRLPGSSPSVPLATGRRGGRPIKAPLVAADLGTMLIAVLALLSVALVPVTGGSLRALAELRFARAWTLPAALGVQILVISVWPSGPERLLQVLHLVSYALAAWFLVANRRTSGLALIAVGALLNVVVITANDGVMPASPSAFRTAGIDRTDDFENSAPTDDARLAFLGDVFAVPEGWPLANVFSVGDVGIVLGAGVLVVSAGRRRAVSTQELTASAVP
jgi:hypothetical protein